MECLLTLKRLYETELNEQKGASMEGTKRPSVQSSPVQTKDMKPFLGPGSRRDKSPLRGTSAPTSPPEQQVNVRDKAPAVLTPNLDFEKMADGILRYTGRFFSPCFYAHTLEAPSGTPPPPPFCFLDQLCVTLLNGVEEQDEEPRTAMPPAIFYDLD